MNKRIRKFFVLLLVVFFLFPSGNGILHSEEELLISLDFDNAEIRDVLRVLAEQHNLNIIVSEEVKGEVTVHLTEVRLENALRVILGTEDFGYLKRGNIIEVGSLERLKSLKAAEDEAILGTTTEIFHLKYVNAEEIEKTIKKCLSSKGNTTVYYSTIRSGWPVGGISSGEGSMGVVPRTANKREEFSRMLIVRDFPEYLTKIRQLVEELDKLPKQVLIQTLIVEVSHDLTRDIGIDWKTLNSLGTAVGDIRYGDFGETLRGVVEGGTVTVPSTGFTGLTATYKRLESPRFEAVINALEEKGKANVLSNPKILVLNGHEATILVGEKYPILTTDISADGNVTSESLAHYEPIGITLKVVPIIWEGDRVNMSIHPAVTELGDNVTGSTGLTVKRITTRELDTNITINSGETIVIGGLIKNKETVTRYKVPLIGDIPILGWLFKRERKVTEKTELLIFITPTIMDTPQLTEGERASMEETSKKLKKEFGLRPKKLKEEMNR
ncbi:MAG: secretin N-terminal domain-containing protein [bacterium]|nr:secretin N-terminal domain-containing protein [bacterium]